MNASQNQPAKAYYNELDPLKAEILREAIKDGAIAPGDVDERSIADVGTDELLGYTQCHFFAGGGFWSVALRQAGWRDEWPVWTGSCPCPSFSAAGKGQGFDDPRHLWPHWARLIAVCRPAVVFGEQVSAAIGHGWLDLVQTDLERENYAVGKAVLGACSVGAPHIRQRLFFVAEPECLRLGGGRFNNGVGPESGRDEAAERRAVCQPAAPRSAAMRVADTAIPRRADAGQYGSGLPSLSARSEQCGTPGIAPQGTGDTAGSGTEQLADTGGERHDRRRAGIESDRDASPERSCTEFEFERPRDAGIVVDATQRRRGIGWHAPLATSGGHTDSTDHAGILGESENEGLQECQLHAGSDGQTVCPPARQGLECRGDAGGVENTDGLFTEQSARTGPGPAETDGAGPHGEPAGRSSSSGLADADGRESSDRRIQRSGQHGLIAQDGGPGGVADTGELGWERREGSAHRDESDGTDAGWLEGHRGPERGHQDVRGVADTGGGQLSLPVGGPHRRNGTGSDGQDHSAVPNRPGALNGYWADADWIGCRDGKFRPVESGTFPLAHGSTARVGRLRLYGDAICVPAAQAFIEAYLETRNSKLAS